MSKVWAVYSSRMSYCEHPTYTLSLQYLRVHWHRHHASWQWTHGFVDGWDWQAGQTSKDYHPNIATNLSHLLIKASLAICKTETFHSHHLVVPFSLFHVTKLPSFKELHRKEERASQLASKVGHKHWKLTLSLPSNSKSFSWIFLYLTFSFFPVPVPGLGLWSSAIFDQAYLCCSK